MCHSIIKSEVREVTYAVSHKQDEINCMPMFNHRWQDKLLFNRNQTDIDDRRIFHLGEKEDTVH